MKTQRAQYQWLTLVMAQQILRSFAFAEIIISAPGT